MPSVSRKEKEKQIQDINGNPAFSDQEKKAEILKLSPMDEIKHKASVVFNKSIKKLKGKN